MVTEANKRVFRRFYEEAWNTGDLGIIDELLDTNFVNHELVDVVGSHRESYKQALTETREAFPDWETTIDDLRACLVKGPGQLLPHLISNPHHRGQTAFDIYCGRRPR